MSYIFAYKLSFPPPLVIIIITYNIIGSVRFRFVTFGLSQIRVNIIYSRWLTIPSPYVPNILIIICIKLYHAL